MGRVWSSITVPFDMQIDNVHLNGGDSDTVSLGICFPASWDVDTEYDPRIQVLLTIYLLATYTIVGGPLATADTITVDIGGDTTTLNPTDTGTEVFAVTRTWTSSLPTGGTEITLSMDYSSWDNPLNDCDIDRDIGWGPDSSLVVNLGGTAPAGATGGGEDDTEAIPGDPEIVKYPIFSTSTALGPYPARPTASATWDGVSIRLKDTDEPCVRQTCLERSNGTYMWVDAEMADPV